MAVKAIYMGERANGEYWVNVRTAKPKGMIGDAGFIRRFDSKKEAKEYAKTVNKTGIDHFTLADKPAQVLPIRHEGDVFVKAV